MFLIIDVLNLASKCYSFNIVSDMFHIFGKLRFGRLEMNFSTWTFVVNASICENVARCEQKSALNVKK